MTSSRPYLIRALYEWIVDNGFTPYMLVDTSLDMVEVPRAFVENGRIILNISPEATHSLVLGNEAVTFNARVRTGSQRAGDLCARERTGHDVR